MLFVVNIDIDVITSVNRMNPYKIKGVSVQKPQNLDDKTRLGHRTNNHHKAGQECWSHATRDHGYLAVGQDIHTKQKQG